MKRRNRNVLRAGTLQSPNLEDDLLIEETDTVLLNHQRYGDLLVDDDEKLSEDLHFPILAKKVQAAIEDEDLLSDDDLLMDMPENGIVSDEDDEGDILADVTGPYEDDEEDGVRPSLLFSASEDEDENDDEEVDEEQNVKRCKARYVPAAVVLSLSDTDTLPQDVKPQVVMDTEKTFEETKVVENDESGAQRGENVEDTSLVNNQNNTPLAVDASSEYSLVDLDQLSDSTEDVMFASVENCKWAIHNNRIIATLTDTDAEQMNVGDVFLDDEYDEATLAEVKSKGLRAGLRSMGYRLATVKMKASAQIESRVSSLTASVKAKLEADAKAKTDVLQQSLAIAAVGLNRNLFKDHTNELRNSLVASLEAAGVRDARRLVKASFEKHGVDYVKTLLAAADEISELPEDSRDGLASQLDMTNEPEDDVLADPNLYGDPVTGEGNCVGEDCVAAALRTPLKATSIQKRIEDNPLPFVRI